MKANTSKNKNAFTLVEVILYIGIVSFVVASITAFVGVIIENRTKTEAISEVDQQGIQVNAQIENLINSANSINVPIAGASGPSLSLGTVNPATNPTLISLNVNSRMQLTEGALPAVLLTSNSVTVSNLIFYNRSSSAADLVVTWQFDLTYLNNSGLASSNFSKTFYGTKKIR